MSNKTILYNIENKFFSGTIYTMNSYFIKIKFLIKKVDKKVYLKAIEILNLKSSIQRTRTIIAIK